MTWWTTAEVVQLLDRYRGRTYLGAIVRGDYAELVFSEDRGGNLAVLSLSGLAGHGHAPEPERYLARYGGRRNRP